MLTGKGSTRWPMGRRVAFDHAKGCDRRLGAALALGKLARHVRAHSLYRRGSACTYYELY